MPSAYHCAAKGDVKSASSMFDPRRLESRPTFRGCSTILRPSNRIAAHHSGCGSALAGGSGFSSARSAARGNRPGVPRLSPRDPATHRDRRASSTMPCPMVLLRGERGAAIDQLLKVLRRGCKANCLDRHRRKRYADQQFGQSDSPGPSP